MTLGFVGMTSEEVFFAGLDPPSPVTEWVAKFG